MVAEPFAGSPVGDPGVDPALEYREVPGLEAGRKSMGPGRDDEGLL